MKQGIISVEHLKKELVRKRMCRQDLIADTKSLKLGVVDGRCRMSITGLESDEVSYAVSPLAHHQLAERIQIPWSYYERCLAEAPELFERNVNHWLWENPEQRMIRILDGRVRAVLSSRYRRLDNLELLETILPEIQQMEGAEIESMDVTDTHMYIKVINHTLKQEIVPGDVVSAGFVLSNSEVGKGSICVTPLIYRLVCKNGLIMNDLRNRKYHIGRNVETTESVYEIYSDATLALDDAAYFAKAKDVVRTAIDEVSFGKIVDRLRQAKSLSTGDDPNRTVKVLGERFSLSNEERMRILGYFLTERDSSLFGLTNAVTRASQDCESYNRATELETFGGTLLQEGLSSRRSRKDLNRELLVA